VIKTAIENENLKLLTDNAWPEIGMRLDYSQSMIGLAAKSVIKKYLAVKDIIVRVKAEPEFAKKMGDLVRKQGSQLAHFTD
jgi:hypothetical protein